MKKNSSAAASPLDRRELLAYTAAFGSAFLAAQGLAQDDAASKKNAKRSPQVKGASGRRYDMKKSIGLSLSPTVDTRRVSAIGKGRGL